MAIIPSDQRPTPVWAVVASVVLLGARSVATRQRQRQRAAALAAKRQAREHFSSRSGDQRGRAARTPTEMPASGWRDALLRVFYGISEARIVSVAGGVTFFALLAIFPGLAGLISLYGLFADSSTISQHLNSLQGVLPEGGLQILRDQLQNLTSQPARNLGLATIAGLAISLWSANGGTKAMFDALNIVYEEKEKRSFFKLNAVSLALTLGGIAFIIAALLTITVLPKLLSFLGTLRHQ